MDSTEFLALKNYVSEQQSLYVPSKLVAYLIECVECYFRNNEESLVRSRKRIEARENAIKEHEDAFQCFESCHRFAEKLVQEFLICQLQFALRRTNEKLLSKAHEQAKCGSKSVGMCAAVTSIK